MSGNKKLNTNSNVYTIVYSAILVVIVAFLLAFVSSALKPTQDVNVALDKKRQILAALNIRNLDNDAVAGKYRQIIVRDDVIDSDNNVLTKGTQGGEAAGFKLNSADYKAGRLALYVCNVNGETKYVIPVYGMGLWGPISGYIAIDSDKNTVYGADFSHSGETPGLGAEIATPAFSSKFKGKQIFRDGEFKSIAVVKPGKSADGQDYVDGISGGTITSQGVDRMLFNSLNGYVKFLTSQN